MAAPKKNAIVTIPLDTKVDLVALGPREGFIKTLTYGEALERIKNKKRGFYYYIYQLGYSQFENLIRI